jgi:hypothetical protein
MSCTYDRHYSGYIFSGHSQAGSYPNCYRHAYANLD